MRWYFSMPFLKGKLDSGPHMVAVAEAQLLALSRSPHGGYTPAKYMVLPPFSPNLRINDCMGWQMSRDLEWNCTSINRLCLCQSSLRVMFSTYLHGRQALLPIDLFRVTCNVAFLVHTQKNYFCCLLNSLN